MGIARRYDTSMASPPNTADFKHRVNQISLPALVSIVLAGTLVIAMGLIFFGLWWSRRRAERKERRNRVEVMSIDSGDVPTITGRRFLGGKKLKKSASALSKLESGGDSPPRPPKRRSMPLFPRVFSGPKFARTMSLNWSTKLHTGGGSRKNPSWIDADALHGPEIRPQPKQKRRSRLRDSWPIMGNRKPTVPNLYHASQGYPYEDRLTEDALFGIDHIRSAYGQLRMYSRILPAPPRPAVLASRDRKTPHMRTMSTPINVNMYALEDAQSQGIVPVATYIPQARSLPNTPLKHRPRQASTDSTLSEILRSTEKRLQEGGMSKRKKYRIANSPSKMGTSRECLLDQAEGVEEMEAEVPPSATQSSLQPRTPSPKKVMATRSTTPGHKRQDSEASVVSESDSLLDELLFQVPDCPSGLTSPSRKHKTPQPEVELVPVQSTRTSMSSALSTVYSEDERSEGARTTVNTPGVNTPGGISPEHINAENIKSIMVSPESMADPFSPTARPSTSHGWPGKNKGPDLFRESLKRSQNLRRMTLGQTLSLPPEVKLPPCPLPSGRRSPSFRSIDYAALRRPEPIGARAKSPSPSSKIPIKANEVPSAPLNKKLGTIVLPPPASSTPRPACPTATDSNRHSCSPVQATTPSRSHSRASTASPLRLTRNPSTTSSIYSQDPDPVSSLTTLFASPSRSAPTPPSRASLTATVAELRRMNSCISEASTIVDTTSPTSQNNIHPLLRDSVFSPSKRRSGSRHYLSLGVTPPRSPRRNTNLSLKGGRESPLSAVTLGGSPQRRVGGTRVVSRKISQSPVRFEADGEEKENLTQEHGGEEGGYKMPTVEFTFSVYEDEDGGKEKGLRIGGSGNGNGMAMTPAAKRRRYESGRAGSQESLGLYDQDGFLIGTPARFGGSSPVQVC
ncbi:hypothetical protein QBC34DRAFT_44296 [Podospora aff. communis PSN243]|uniref:Uncharacterized protein n=1 Tax=Podospora aff. communis PSN243 TaxID=3040156 RepID=A0AAV9GSK7_9PEZI|nr:hypothetical protein QBC34DRAFT_44296 [Podospora aff. communis PSN243]